MAFCGVCEKECSDVNGIKYAGKCEHIFHLKNESEEKITRGTKDWKCSFCKSKSSTHGSVKSTSSATEVLSKDFLVKVMERLKKDVFSEISNFRKEMNELSTSVQHVSDKLDDSNNIMEEIRRQFDEPQKENSLLKTKNELLSKEVVDLRERMRKLEQYSRVKNIEISGLPLTQGESIGERPWAWRCRVQSADIAAVHRVPSYKKDREPTVIVQFTTRQMKELWIAKYRENKSLTARQVNQHFPVSRVYVNEHLSPENKQFLAKLKQKGRDLGYKFIWCDEKFFYEEK